MKKIFYLWILPFFPLLLFISMLVYMMVFSIQHQDEIEPVVGWTFVGIELGQFFLIIVTSYWYSATVGYLRKTRKIINIWMSKYFKSENIEFTIQSEINIESKTVDTSITFNGKQLKFYTEQIFLGRQHEAILWFNSNRKYEKHIESISSESKQQLMREIELLSDKKTTLYLYKDDVEIKSQPMPRRFPFIYLSFNEFRADLNKFLDRESTNPDEIWKTPTLSEEKTT